MRKNLIAHVGETVHLNCTTSRDIPVDWKHDGSVIYVNDAIDESLRAKYSIDKPVSGHFMLVIKNVSGAEAGEYTCIDNAGFGPRLISYILTVTGNN